ncbi:MAG: hypothetical protein JKY15_02605 [Deltaproteobacteria bacterium]|nr:hypothetical protein [Deltaproteobacteria bacterium]
MKSSQLQVRVSPIQKQALNQAALAAGLDLSSWVLSKLLKDPQTQFSQKIEAIPEKKYSFALADLADFLNGLDAEQFEKALQKPWDRHLSPFLSNYIAAMLEWSAHRLGVNTPWWLRQIEPLKEPYFGTKLQSLRFYLLHHSPAPFRARNIFIDTSLGGRV